VSIEVSPVNLGFAAGVNRGIDWIRANRPGSWILILNNDAVLLPGGLSALCCSLAGHPEAILVYPAIDHGGRVLGTVWYQRWFGLITPKPLPGSFPYPSGCAILFAPERWETPLFDEDFFMYGEDIRLGWMHRNTGRLLHLPKVCVWHEGSASSGMGTAFYERRLVAAHLLLAAKTSTDLSDLFFSLTMRVMFLCCRALARSVRFHHMLPLRVLVGETKVFLGLLRNST
jgi:GT2 family glycosyltransferase